MAIPDWITNEFLRTHLNYVEHTESPVLMHVWSAITSASACLGRHVHLDFGIGNIYPNLYVLLVGPPGCRKSQAIGYASDLVEAGTNIRFAPDDTNGQRQGLIAAIEGKSEDEEDADTFALEAAVGVIEGLSSKNLTINGTDAHCMFVCADEFQSFIGQNSLEMTTFMIKMYDGKKKYDYKLKKEKNTLTNPLLAMIGGTTPTSIASIIPEAAVGQGFMSRIVLVHAPEKAKSVPRPYLNNAVREDLIVVYRYLANQMSGEIKESAEARLKLDAIYGQPINITDNRFIYYSERRHTHLLKLCMVLAACRKSHVIELEDVEQGQKILTETEKTMPDALGQFGLSPLAQAKQKMVEFIQFAKGPVHNNILWAVMQRDMKMVDFRNCISDLINANKIEQVDTKDGVAVIYKEQISDAIDALIDHTLTGVKTNAE